MSDIAFFDQTARNPNVRLDIIADMNPSQLNESSAADARETPSCTHDLSQEQFHDKVVTVSTVIQTIISGTAGENTEVYCTGDRLMKNVMTSGKPLGSATKICSVKHVITETGIGPNATSPNKLHEHGNKHSRSGGYLLQTHPVALCTSLSS